MFIIMENSFDVMNDSINDIDNDIDDNNIDDTINDSIYDDIYKNIVKFGNFIRDTISKYGSSYVIRKRKLSIHDSFLFRLLYAKKHTSKSDVAAIQNKFSSTNITKKAYTDKDKKIDLNFFNKVSDELSSYFCTNDKTENILSVDGTHNYIYPYLCERTKVENKRKAHNNTINKNENKDENQNENSENKNENKNENNKEIKNESKNENNNAINNENKNENNKENKNENNQKTKLASPLIMGIFNTTNQCPITLDIHRRVPMLSYGKHKEPSGRVNISMKGNHLLIIFLY